jgi:hypothetical protein
METSSCLTHTPAEAEGVVEMENDMDAKGWFLKITLKEIIITRHISHWSQLILFACCISKKKLHQN